MTITYGGSVGTASAKTTGTTLSVTGSAPVGSTVVITYACLGAIGGITASDNGGNTYTTDYISSTSAPTVAIISGQITSSFSTITITQNASNSGRSAGVDYFTASSPLQFDIGTATSGSSASPSATLTGAKSGVKIGITGINGPTTAPTGYSWTPLSGFSVGTSGGSVASNVYQVSVYDIDSTQSFTADSTYSVSRTWREAVVSYIESAVVVNKTLTDTITTSDNNIQTVYTAPIHAQKTLTDTVTTSENVTVRGPVHAQMTLTDTITASEISTGTTPVDILEDFEDTNYNFNFSGSWIRANTSYQGSWSYANNDISDSQSTSSSFTVNIPTGATNPKLSLYYMTSSEVNYDWLSIYINGTQQLHKSGSIAWTYVEFVLPTGSNTIRLEYLKDSSASVGSDTVYIDNLRLSYGIPTSPFVVSKGSNLSLSDSFSIDDQQNLTVDGSYYYAINQGGLKTDSIRILAPSFQYTDVEIDFSWNNSNGMALYAFYDDYGSPAEFFYAVSNNQATSTPTTVSTSSGMVAYINGVQSTSPPPMNTRLTLKLTSSTPTFHQTSSSTDPDTYGGAFYIGADGGSGKWVPMKIYGIRFYDGSVIGNTLIANFDLTTGTFVDQTGRGRVAKPIGGYFARDVAGKVAGRKFIESTSVTDSMTQSTGGTRYNLALSDIVSSGDTITNKQVGAFKADIVNVGGEGGTALTFVESDGADVIWKTDSQAFSDSFTISDTIAVRKIANRTLTESVALSETFTKKRTKTLTDAVASAETFKKQFNKSYTESVLGADSMATLVLKTKTFTESISSSETVAQVKTKTLADSISSGDSVSTGGTHNYTVTLTDAIGTTDSVTKVVASKKSLSDPVGTSDIITKGLAAAKSDPISTSDSVAKAQLSTKSLSDSITESDSIAKARTKTVTDSIGTSETIVTGKSYSETETINPSDTVAKSFTKTLTESIATSDSIPKATKTKKLTESIFTNDIVSVGGSHAYAVMLTDTILTSDTKATGGLTDKGYWENGKITDRGKYVLGNLTEQGYKIFSSGGTAQFTVQYIQGTRSYTATLTDTVAASDSITKGKSSVLNDSASINDSISTGSTHSYSATFTDTFNTTDSVSKRITAFKTLTESITTADTEYEKKSMTISDSITETDTVKKLKSMTFNESITSSDTVNKLKSITFTESITSNDTVNEAKTKKLTDSISSNDSLATGSTRYNTAILTDSIGTSDTMTKINSAVRTLTESVVTTDTEYEKKSMTIAETITGTDTIKKLKSETLSDTVLQSDTVNKLKSITFTETIATSDTIGQAKTKKLTDSVNSNDSLSTGSTHNFAGTLTDSIGTTDSVAKIITAFRTLTDSVATADTEYDKKSMTIADSITQSDTVKKLKSISFTETIATSDTIGEAKTKKLNDSISSNDSISAGGTHTYATTFTDSIGTSDSVTKLNSAVRTLTDSISTADTEYEKKSMTMTETIGATDSIAKVITAYKSFTDSISTADTEYEKKSMTITETITQSDTVNKLKSLSFAESIATSDTIGTAKTKKLSDSIGTNDTLLTSNSHYTTLSLADSIGTSDSIVKAKPVTLVDSVTTADTEYEKKSMTVSDSIGTTDSISKKRTSTVSDSVATSDTENDKTSKTFTEAVSTSDTVTKKFSTAKAETVASSDTMTPLFISGVRNWTMTLTDTIPTSDSVMSGTSHARSVTLSDSIIVSETLTKLGAKSVADSVASGDTPSKRYNKPLSDTQGFNDSVAKLFRRGLTDSVANSDTASKGANFPRTFSDTISTSDTASRNAVHRITFNDSILAEDFIYLVVKRYMQLAEVILQNDSIGGAGTNTVNVSDTVGMSDSIKKQIIRNNADSISTSESMGKLFSTARYDTFVLQDNLYKQSAKQKADSMAISEALSKMLGKIKSDSISTGDTENKTGKVNVYDGILLADFLYKAYKRGITFNDSIPISDSTGSGTGNTKGFQDSISLSDVIFKQLGKLKADSINLGESSKDTYGRVFPESITIQDYLYTVIRRAIFISDNVGVGDLTGSGGGKAVGITDTVTLVETLTKKLVKMRTDSIAAGDIEKAQATKALIDYIIADDVLFKRISQSRPETINLTDTRQKTQGKVMVETVPTVDILTHAQLQNVYLYDMLFATDSPLAKLLASIPTPIDTTIKPIVLNVEITRLISIILDK
jgi:hypothetical protein